MANKRHDLKSLTLLSATLAVLGLSACGADGGDLTAGDDAGLDAASPIGAAGDGAASFPAPDSARPPASGVEVAGPDDEIVVAGESVGRVLAGDGVRIAATITGADGAGRIAIYGREPVAGWKLEATVEPPATEDPLLFGVALALDGDTLVVGAFDEPGTVSVLYSYSRRPEGTWQQTERIPLPLVADPSALALALDGDTLVVGDLMRDDEAGAAEVYRRQGLERRWAPQQTVRAHDAARQAHFGVSVAIDGDRLLIGAVEDGAKQQGAAYVFVREGPGDAFTARHKLAGASGTETGFGEIVAISGETVAVSAPFEEVDGQQWAGAVYVFSLAADDKVTRGRITAPGPAARARFGTALALAGSRLVVSTGGDDPSGGAALLLAREQDRRWRPSCWLVDGPSPSSRAYGRALALSADAWVFVGAPVAAGTGGAVLVHQR